MDICLHTNIDSYSAIVWPILNYVPRIGEHVEIPSVFHQTFAKRKLPYRLQVVDVTYKEKIVLIEMWFDPTDVKLWQDADTRPMVLR